MVSIARIPSRKVPEDVKVRAEDPACVFDVHIHTFNREDVPNGFLKIRLPYSRRFMSFCQGLTKAVGSLFRNKDITGTSYFLGLFKRPDSSILAVALQKYPAHTIVSPLMVDMQYSIKGRMRTSYPQQLTDMEKLVNLHPGRLLPFFGLNPVRLSPTPLEFLCQYVLSEAHPYWGIKLYPSLGYLPSDPRLMMVYRICERNNIPITVHCSAATVHTTKHRIKNIRWIDRTGQTRTIKKRWFWRNEYDWFNDPKHWGPVFAEFPNLTVNFAHFGGEKQWKLYMAGKDNTWVHRIMNYMARFPNVYADFAYTLHSRKAVMALRQLMDDNAFVYERTLYGSDFYMVTREGHMRSIVTSFMTIMGDHNGKAATHTNPKRFLFGK
jgi:predicted TIM-barrel fold metal-dependent hydrolase